MSAFWCQSIYCFCIALGIAQEVLPDQLILPAIEFVDESSKPARCRSQLCCSSNKSNALCSDFEANTLQKLVARYIVTDSYTNESSKSLSGRWRTRRTLSIHVVQLMLLSTRISDQLLPHPSSDAATSSMRCSEDEKSDREASSIVSTDCQRQSRL